MMEWSNPFLLWWNGDFTIWCNGHSHSMIHIKQKFYPFSFAYPLHFIQLNIISFLFKFSICTKVKQFLSLTIILLFHFFSWKSNSWSIQNLELTPIIHLINHFIKWSDLFISFLNKSYNVIVCCFITSFLFT